MDSNKKDAAAKLKFRCRSQEEIMRETGREWKDSTYDERMEALEHLRQITWPNYSPHDRIERIVSFGNRNDLSDYSE